MAGGCAGGELRPNRQEGGGKARRGQQPTRIAEIKLCSSRMRVPKCAEETSGSEEMGAVCGQPSRLNPPSIQAIAPTSECGRSHQASDTFERYAGGSVSPPGLQAGRLTRQQHHAHAGEPDCVRTTGRSADAAGKRGLWVAAVAAAALGLAVPSVPPACNHRCATHMRSSHYPPAAAGAGAGGAA